MLTRRSLTLVSHQQRISEPLLRREAIERCLLAEQLLEAAQVQADALIETAREDARQLREDAGDKARAEVWQEAKILFEDWQVQREHMWQHIEQTARDLLLQGLQIVLGEQPSAARVDALFLHLKSAQPADEVGVLHCHPDLLEVVAERMKADGSRPWTLRADPLLGHDALCLQGEQGDFTLSWSTLQRSVLPSVPS